MSDLPEAGRQSAHVWLDLVSTYDDAAPELWQTSVSAALPRFSEVGAFTADFDEEESHLTVDASNLLLPGAVIMQWLIHALADARGQDRTDVIVWLREQMDEG